MTPSPIITFTPDDGGESMVIAGSCEREEGHPIRRGLRNSTRVHDHVHKMRAFYTQEETGYIAWMWAWWTDEDDEGVFDALVNPRWPGEGTIERRS